MSVPTGLERRLAALRTGVCAVAVLGAILLLASTQATVLEIVVGGSRRVAPGTDLSHTGWERHGPALVLLALLALGLCAVAWRGSRAAAAAIAVCGLAALLIVLIGDLPDLDETGFVGTVYADADAGPGTGWYLETAGSVLLLAAGTVLAVLTPGPARTERGARPTGRTPAETAADRARARADRRAPTRRG
jgi:hypothetical protein